MLAFTFALAIQVAVQPTRADSLSADSVRARRARRLEAVQVTAVRGGTAPVSAKTIQRAELQRRYAGQETPILLQASPGITAYSESGSASNYSYMRLRGMDQTRINLTLDGVPLNEPEDQALFFSNFPDFANNISSVQVQRGVGSSSHGTASYAGSVNFESEPVTSAQRGGELQLTRGAYGTSRGSASYRSGVSAGGLAGIARISAQRTDGYRFNSGNESRGLFASGSWLGTRDVVKATVLAGVSENQQAYLASPLSVLRANPRDNPYGNTEATAVGDRFHQTLLSLGWTRALAASVTLGATAYGFDAGGWYDVPGASGVVDAFNYNLRSRWGGVIGALDWSSPAASASIGMHASRYARDHWLSIRPDRDARLYDNTGHKAEQSAFAKGSLTRGRITFSGDLQLRFARFRYDPTAGSSVVPASVRWTFLNPKTGVRVRVTDALSAYASAGGTEREPTRADMFAGADDVDSTTARSVLPLTRVRPESVRDVEAGVTWRRAAVSAQANLFLMHFRNEIAPIGAINEIGYLLRKNVARSVRRGVEGDLSWQLAPRLAAHATLSMTEARIAEYRDDATGSSYRDVTALLTPAVVSGHGLRAEPTSWLSIDADGRYTSRMMLTNTNDPRFVVPANWSADVGVTVRIRRAAILLQVRNLFDQRVYTGGYPGPDASGGDPAGPEPYYYTLASRNLTVHARVPLP